MKKAAANNEEAIESNVQAVEDEVEDIVSEFFEDDSPAAERDDQESFSGEDEFEGTDEYEDITTNEKETLESESTETEIAAEEEVVEAVNEESTQETAQYSPPPSSSYGKYIVIAGSFSVEGNADKMVDKLKAKGFTNASKLVFDDSNLYSVAANRFDSRSEAYSFANDLKAQGIDCYVHTRQ